MEDIELKSVNLSDVNDLQHIAKHTFTETFSAENSLDNMTKYLQDGFSIAKLTNEINSEGSQFYFALSGTEVIGYLKVNEGSSQTELQDDKALEIERIYVLGKYHGKKVGQLLYNKAIEIAITLHLDYVWLGVYEKNPRAIRFYQKNGFVEFDRHVFMFGNDKQIDIMMKKSL